jgi:peptidoglycan/LPS O-acetylase OafA/YrhL
MGLYSYCFYLIHIGILSHERFLSRNLARLHLTSVHTRINYLLLDCVAFSVTFAICAASYKFFELPIRKLKRFFPYRERTSVEELLPSS